MHERPTDDEPPPPVELLCVQELLRYFVSVKMYELIMSRHGEPEEKNMLMGWMDAQLSSDAIREAQNVGKPLKNNGYKFDMAFTSKLTRAQTTLQIILQQMEQEHIPTIRTWHLNARHYGNLTGLTRVEAYTIYGENEVMQIRKNYSSKPPPIEANNPTILSNNEDEPKCESLEQTIARVISFWDDVIVPHIKAGKSILIIAHRSSLRGIIMYLEHNMTEENILKVEIPYCCPFKYKLNECLKPVSNSSFHYVVKKALVFLAPGAEEIEFILPVDVLRRGGVIVAVAGLPDKSPITCRNGVVIIPDIGISEVAYKGPFDVLVLPGGCGGSNALAESQEVGKLLKEHENNGRIVAAICAAPTALKKHRIGMGRNVTSHPSKKAVMMEGGSYVYEEDNVVAVGTLITSRGPGTSAQFALKILEKPASKEKACEVAEAMLL